MYSRWDKASIDGHKLELLKKNQKNPHYDSVFKKNIKKSTLIQS